jgi:hypothetical protein
MKMFSVHLEVSLSEIGDAEEISKPKPPFSDSVPGDSPIKDVAKLFDHMQDRGMFPAPGATPLFIPGMRQAGDSLAMTHGFKVIVGSFEEMQQVLAKFREVADKLSMPVAE